MLFPSFSVVVAAFFLVAAVANWFIWEIEGTDGRTTSKKRAETAEPKHVGGSLHAAA